MTPYEIEKATADFLALNWSYTPVRLVNSEDKPALPYIECFFRPGQTFNAEIQGVGIKTGVFIINIYTKIGVGVQEGGVYAGKLEELFWHKQIEDIAFENDLLPYSEDVGIDEELQAYRHKVVIPFDVILEY